MKLVYADQPYPKCCALYGHFHGDDGKCWDDPQTHLDLMARVHEEYDGWAMSSTSSALAFLAPAMPEQARIAAWVKPFAAYKRNVRIAYTWEPVIFVPGRDRSADGAMVGRDHLSCPITLRRGFTGAKPPEFCRWVFDLLGATPDDEFVDLFTGSGAVTAAWGRFQAERQLPWGQSPQPVEPAGDTPRP